MERDVSKKLTNLLKLQEIDSKIFDLKTIRGALPQEVQDLEDELEGYNTRLDNHKNELGTINQDIDDFKNKISEAKKLIKKYKDQQLNVRNNREYDAISKEIEVNELDLKIFKKKILEKEEKIESTKDIEKVTKKKIKEKKLDLNEKKSELDTILSESKGDEVKLNNEKLKRSKKIEKNLLLSYTKLVERQRNGLAIVKVKRGACGGCFNVVPPQRQTEIKQKMKIILCEFCGRILADVEDVVEKEKPKRKVTRKAKKTTAKKTTAKKTTAKKTTAKKTTAKKTTAKKTTAKKTTAKK
mgnify:CR=1 FL=1